MLRKPILSTLAQSGGKVVMVLISLVTTAILTRKLGVEIYGSFTLLTATFILLDALADFGSRVIGVREAAKKKGEERKKIFTQLAWLRLMNSLLAFGVGLILIFYWRALASIRLESLIALVMIFFTSIAGSLEIIFQTEEKMELKVIMDILFPLSFLVILLIWGNQVTLLWVFGVYLLARIISLLVGLGIIKKILGGIEIKKWDVSFLKKTIIEIWPMGVYLIIFTGYDRAVDAMMIERMIGIKEVAFYGLAYKIYGNLIQPAYFFINSIFPTLSRNKGGSKKLMKNSLLLISLGLLVAVPIVYFLAPWIIKVLSGGTFGESVLVLRLLLIALVFAYFNHLFGFRLISLGGQKKMLFLGLIALVFNLSGNLFLIPRMGIRGAAIITALTELLILLLTVIVLKKSRREE